MIVQFWHNSPSIMDSFSGVDENLVIHLNESRIKTYWCSFYLIMLPEYIQYNFLLLLEAIMLHKERHQLFIPDVKISPALIKKSK